MIAPGRPDRGIRGPSDRLRRRDRTYARVQVGAGQSLDRTEGTAVVGASHVEGLRGDLASRLRSGPGGRILLPTIDGHRRRHVGMVRSLGADDNEHPRDIGLDAEKEQRILAALHR